jgi:hypothetical protein
MAGTEMDQLAAAIWAFSGQPAVVKNLIVTEFWFNGIEEPEEPLARTTVMGKAYDVARCLVFD